MDAVDYFIVDIKTMDEEIYTAYTEGQLSGSRITLFSRLTGTYPQAYNKLV